MLKECTNCPRKCKATRDNVRVGACLASENVRLGLVSLHKYEEPCISVGKGSGTIFFCGCNLKCVYCQNSDISQQISGKEVSISRLADIFIEQQNRGAANINLVTPSIYTEQIREALIIAKETLGLKIPVIYNSSGYDSADELKKLEGLIDVYLPDFKYISEDLGKKYSGVSNYVESAKLAILEMYRQVGSPKLDKDGKIISGLIIRHLILPNNVENTKGVLKWIKENIGTDIYISIMAQYFPTNKISDNFCPELNRKISQNELEEVEEYIFDLGFENGFIQEVGEHEEEYVPLFNGQNI